ncbi:damaged DNA-binding protein [Lithospermum erythrorhizon]|uniref:Damaged DNA-binding protein n=1 Tax=Lithospermum erythrorhizon TaxID=34254 RepID=A0AAV3Q2K6_LITER
MGNEEALSLNQRLILLSSKPNPFDMKQFEIGEMPSFNLDDSPIHQPSLHLGETEDDQLVVSPKDSSAGKGENSISNSFASCNSPSSSGEYEDYQFVPSHEISTADKEDSPLSNGLASCKFPSPPGETKDDQLVSPEGSSAAKEENSISNDFSSCNSPSSSGEYDNDQFVPSPKSSTSDKEDIPISNGLASCKWPSPSGGQVNDQAAASSKDSLKEENAHPFSSVEHLGSSPAVAMDHPEVRQESGWDHEENPTDFVRNPGFSNASGYCSSVPGVDSKQTKVKIAGRRRLCKLSSKEDGVTGHDKYLGEDETPKFLEVEDIDSPPPTSKIEGGNYGDCASNEIRDILNDLSSKLDFLSIEKKRPAKKTELVENSVESGVQILQEEKNYRDYKTTASMFSNLSDSFSDSIDGSRAVGVVVTKNDKEWGTRTGLRDDGFSAKVSKPQIRSDMTKEIEVKKYGGKVSYSKALEKVEDDSDDCVVLSGKSVVWKGMKRNEKIKQDSKEVNEMYDYGEAIFTESKDLFTLSDPKSSYRLPSGIAQMLYPHQRDGLKWLWSLHCQRKGGILGDDMGLGKTMQICGFLAGLYHSKLIKRTLIVAPKTLLPHWIKELSAVGLSCLTKEYFGTCAKARQYELQFVLQDKGILLTTYDIVRNNVKSLSSDRYIDDDAVEDDNIWDYMILDEGHLIKNPATQRAKSLHEIPCAHRIIISGTPIQNDLKELWALFNFCCPELLGDKKWFKEKYENPVLRGNNKDASDRDKRVSSTVAKELRERIQPYFLRRLKSEVFNGSDTNGESKLSKKDEIIVWLKLTSCQRHIYEAFLKSEIVLSACDGSPLAALTILKKICDHPLLLTKRAAKDVLDGMDDISNQEDHRAAENLAMHIADVAERFDITEKHDVSCKVSFILSLLDNLIPEGHNVLIFSQTRKMLDLIQNTLSSNSYEFMRIDGTTKASDRLKIVNDFQEGRGASIFLLTSQVGGLGLTLTNADRVIVVDPAWNPSTDNQSVDRAYRIGQNKDVIVYRLMTSGTVEEKIYRKQVFKGGLFKTATEHKEQVRYFSQQDLRDIFRLPEHGFDVSVTQQQLHEEHGQQLIMEDSLSSHIKFLETLGIAGVSHHSLLFSKTAPAPDSASEEELLATRGTSSFGNAASSSSQGRNIDDAAAYAFNPKDLNVRQKKTSTTASEPTESEIAERISRLSQICSNKVTMSRLPDKGLKIQNQIYELEQELSRMRDANQKKQSANDIIDLEDDIYEEFQRVLRV